MADIGATPDRTAWLPSRPLLHPDEALDGYLERLADANGLRPGQLLDLLTAKVKPTVTQPPSFVGIPPPQLVVLEACRMSGLEVGSLVNATLQRFDGFPHALPPDVGLSGCSRHVRTRGAIPRFGSQACPVCLAQDGIWRLRWRLPVIAVCIDHRCLLNTHCAACSQRFRSNSNAPLRACIRALQDCGNLAGLSKSKPCRHPVVDHAVEPATDSQVTATRVVLDALSGQPGDILGVLTEPTALVREICSLAKFLLNAVERPAGRGFIAWDGAGRSPRRSARSGTSRDRLILPYPRQHPDVRAGLLAAAVEILGEASIADGAARLRPWLGAVAGLSAGEWEWSWNRCSRTPTVDLLISAVSGRGVGRRALDPAAARRTAAAIPHLIDNEIYDRLFADKLNVDPWTGRLYVSLCVARVLLSANGWPQAAWRIAMDPELAMRAVLAASAELLVTAPVFAAAVHEASRTLPAGRDFRRCEAGVRSLVAHHQPWLSRWQESLPPGTPIVSAPYAIAWMWCEVAQAPLETSPGWVSAPTSAQRLAYQRVARALVPAEKAALRALVMSSQEALAQDESIVSCSARSERVTPSRCRRVMT